MSTIYGIDVGSWRVRIAAMEGRLGRFELRDVAQIALALDEQGAPRLPEALTELRSGEQGWEAADKVAAYPLDGGVVRLVKLPFSDRTAIAKALPAEVESQVPYDLDEMVLATNVLEAKDNASRTTAFIAPREDVQARIERLAEAGADPRSLCFDADALAAYAGRGVQVIADIGHRRTVLAVCQDGALLTARLVPSGGAELTAAVAHTLGVSPADAESAKHASSLPHAPVLSAEGEWTADERRESGVAPQQAAVIAALLAAVDAYAAEIRAELIALEDELGLGVDELLTCGGGARLGGLNERLAEQIGVPVRFVQVPGGHPVEFALAVALARVGAGERKATDLRIGTLAYRGAGDTLWNIVSATVLGGAVAFVAAVGLFAVQYSEAASRLDEIDASIASTIADAHPDAPDDAKQEPVKALAFLQSRVTEMEARVDALGATVSGVPPTLDLLKTLSDAVPPNSEARIDVRELTIDEDSVNVRAETDSYESAAKIESALQRQDRFKEARKSDEKKVGDALQFTLNIPLKGADDAEGEAGAEEGG